MVNKSNDTIFQIFDRTFKRILTLSARSVVAFINALFGTSYPPDSRITYNWTEHHDDRLHRTIADTILTINEEYSYHIEAQMYEDEEIEFRVFEYGYRHALKHRNDTYILHFPESRIIFLYDYEGIPDSRTIRLDFGTQGVFDYKIPALKLLEYTPAELAGKNMIILIPFMLLKLRKTIAKKRTPENMEALRTLIFDDIIGLIRQNWSSGNITAADAKLLLELIQKLYNYLYAHYRECAQGGLNNMVNEAFVLETDVLIAEHNKEMEKLSAEFVLETDSLIAEHNKEMEKLNAKFVLETDSLIAEHNKEIEKLSAEYNMETDSLIAEHNKEIEKLSAEYNMEADSLIAEHNKEIEKLSAEFDQQIKTKDMVIKKLKERLKELS